MDPTGFEVKTQGRASYREEKIDLPPSWLRGFGQLQAAMALPATRFELSVDVVYSILAYLKRHREKTGPRSLRVKLVPGRSPTLILDPWGVELTSSGAVYDGPVVPGPTGEIKLWGRRRLMSLARLLPLAERFEVMVFGSGLPSIWTAHMGEMRFVLALSGWTANDWTRGSNLDTFFAGFEAAPSVADAIARYLEVSRAATLSELTRQVALPDKQVLAGLHALAKRGQLVYDFAGGKYRWRPLLPVALSESLLGPENPELQASRELSRARAVTLLRDEPLAGGRRLLVARVQSTECEGLLDLDGGFRNAKCSCSYFYKNRLRAGPCRHLLALRTAATRGADEAPAPVVVSQEGKGMIAHLPEAVVAAMAQEAERRRETIHVVAAQAWRIAKARIGKASNLDDVLGGASAAPYRGGSKVAQLFTLPPDVERDVQREAARLDLTVSRILEAAWLLAKDTMKIGSSLLG